MLLRTLYLHNFRCYEEVSFDFCPGVNAIWGANAKGKTTVLEAIHLLITGSSFRTHQMTDLIRKESSFFYIEASFVKHGIEQKLRMTCDGKTRKIIYNATTCASTAELLGLLQGVIVTPDDALLVKGGPQTRRHFLDLQLAQVDPLYIHHLTRYNRAMRQRNALLRTKNADSLSGWEQEMANSAAYLTQQRCKASKELQMSGQRFYCALSGEVENLSLNYKTTTPNNDAELVALKQHHLALFNKLRHREMILGYTLSGPHKDDLTISIGQKEARFFASEGQQRSCVAALRLAEWERLKILSNEVPLMLLDDVGVSLDDTRRERLLMHLQNLGQVFLTSTNEPFIKGFDKEYRAIHLSNN